MFRVKNFFPVFRVDKQSFTLKIEATNSSEMWVDFYHITRRPISEDLMPLICVPTYFLTCFLFIFVLRRPIGLSHTFSLSDSTGNFDKFVELYLAMRATNIRSMPYFGLSQRYCWRFISPLMLRLISWEFPKFWKSVIPPFSVRVPKNSLCIAGPWSWMH